jgi:hypothetical protein
MSDGAEKYAWVEGMGEISGFGGTYEEACRRMLRAGLEWLDANPEASPVFEEFRNVYGLVREKNEDAIQLGKAIAAAAPDCTGAMMQAVVHHCLFVRKNGWNAFVEGMTKRERKGQAS